MFDGGWGVARGNQDSLEKVTTREHDLRDQLKASYRPTKYSNCG